MRGDESKLLQFGIGTGQFRGLFRQRHLRLFALGNVLEQQHFADGALAFTNRRPKVFQHETRAIGPVDHDFHRRSAVRLGHVGGRTGLQAGKKFRNGPANQLLDLFPHDAGRRGIREHDLALHIQSANPFAR